MKTTFLTLALAGLPSMASAQTFTTIATETFDYPSGSLDGQAGGTGWLNPWTGANATVSGPGFDAIGGKATTAVENGGNWRTIDASLFPSASLLDQNNNPAFGVDGTTIWITYSQQRVGGAQDYGGLSLTGFFLGEKLFIGSPGGTAEMGVDSSFCCGGPLASIPSSSADTLHEIVVKVDFLPGDEDVSMWLDPAVPHPVNTPDLMTTAPDFVFNEIRLQSGSGTGGFDFDGILIELEESGGLVEICNGDGGDGMGCTNCPCGNNAMQGTVGGCLNSASSSTRLLRSGSDSIAAMDLRFEATGAPPSVSAVLTSGNALAPANVANPCFGLNSGVQSVSLDGLRCVVQGVLRHGVRPSDTNGDIGMTTNGWGTPNGFFNFAAFTAGTTKHFQIIHRDDEAAICLTGQNTSQASSVTFSN